MEAGLLRKPVSAGLLAAGSLLSAGAILSYAVRGRSASLLAPSVYRGARDRRGQEVDQLEEV